MLDTDILLDFIEYFSKPLTGETKEDSLKELMELRYSEAFKDYQKKLEQLTRYFKDSNDLTLLTRTVDMQISIDEGVIL